ncbi:MAG: cation-transporting P-type ATPase [Gammaproteobacteria bacterium]
MMPADGDTAATPWHALPVEATLTRLGSRDTGLTSAEARERLQQYGPNRLPSVKPRSAWQRFFHQFHNVLIYVLIGSAVVTSLLLHWLDTGVIVGVVLINALIGFIQEGKAQKALEAIQQLLSQHATVRRDGHISTISADEVVPGDIVMLQSGDKVPADLRLFRVKDLRLDEAMLTGESVPVGKTREPVAADAVIGDRRCIAYSGTLVSYGQAYGVVVATGDQSEIGRITRLLGKVERLTTPLLQQMAHFGNLLTFAIGGLTLFTLLFGVLVHHYPVTEMFLAGVGLAVAAIPEGLPAIMTITLAIGVQRMARRNAIIRRLPAVETLGAVSVICTDKTGTLTHNEMMVQQIVTTERRLTITGSGYDFHGEFLEDGAAIDALQEPVLAQLLRAGMLCNDAHLSFDAEQWKLHGDPTEGALISVASKAGLDKMTLAESLPRSDVIPFESQHRYMASLHHDHQGHGYIFVKGAPENLLAMAHTQQRGDHIEPIDKAFWEARMQDMAKAGLRLLAIASQPVSADQRTLAFSDLDQSVTLLGLVGMMDPPRDDAIEAIKRCLSAGISVKMITGDHAITASTIGEMMGFTDADGVLSGAQIDHLDDATLRQTVTDIHIFARTSPEHKLRLVRALQANGNIVAMTGDGVNDAPALKRADIGIAMGRKGTEVAKESAEMVLTDDNFASIAAAVEEGRTVYDNLKKAIIYTLPTSGGEALTIIAAVLLGAALPISPVQILWVNMVTAVSLALSLAFEPGEHDIMRRRPRPHNEPLLSGFLVWRVVMVSLVLLAGTFGLFWQTQAAGYSLAHSQTVAVNTLVMFEIFYLFNTRYLLLPVFNRTGLFGNRYVLYAIAILIMLQLLYTYLPLMQSLFGSRGLLAMDWLKVLAVAMSIFLLVEFEKFVIRRKKAARP